MVDSLGLRRWFLDSLSGYADAVEAACAAIESEDADAAERLREMAHRLAGSAGSYGFERIGLLARRVERAPSTFLPIAAGLLASALRQAASEGHDARATILIVDDDSDMRMLLGAILGSVGRRTRCASCVDSALAVLAEETIDLVLLDLNLPGADGRNFLARLREDESTAAIPVIVLTAANSAATRAECWALGAAAFVPKPVETATLNSTVAGILGSRRRITTTAQTDPLTGLPNRRGFEQAFRGVGYHAAGSNGPPSLAVIDLDRFKAVNDTHGHNTGDAVLVGCSAALRAHLRDTDVLARWGGEEFVVLLPSTGRRGAHRAIESALAAMRTLEFDGTDGRKFSVTASAGVAVVKPGASLGEAIAAADNLLYTAKAAGRDRVVSVAGQTRRAGPSVLLVGTAPGATTLIEHLLDPISVTRVPTESAAQRALQQRFDTVIIALEPSHEAGLDTLRRIRSRTDCRNVPVVILAANPTQDGLTRAFELGADDYLSKPWSPSELTARVRRLIARHRGLVALPHTMPRQGTAPAKTMSKGPASHHSA